MPLTPRTRSVDFPRALPASRPRLLKIERTIHIVRGRVSRPQRFQSESMLDQSQNRAGVVQRVIDVPVLRIRRDDQRRNPRARPPAIHRRRRDVIPESTVLIVSDDHRRPTPLGRRAQRLQ